MALSIVFLSAFVLMEVSSLQHMDPLAPLIDCSRTAPLDLVFLVDTSGSIGEEGFRLSHDFVEKVSHVLTVGTGASDDHVAVIHFASKATVILDLEKGTSVKAIHDALVSSSFTGGGTNLPAGLSYVQKVFKTARNQQAVKQMLLVLTDGESNSVKGLEATAAMIRKDGVDVRAVNIKDGNNDQLQMLVGNSGHILRIARFQELSALVCTTTRTTSMTSSTTTSMTSTMSTTTTTTTTKTSTISTTTTTTKTGTFTSTTSTTTTTTNFTLPFIWKISMLGVAAWSLVCLGLCIVISLLQRAVIKKALLDGKEADESAPMLYKT